MAARPKTLAAGVSPVLVASGLAIRDGAFRWQYAAVCLLIAVLFQVASNFANDYFDYKKGIDTPDRVGPKRAVAEGWVSPRQMLVALYVVLAVAFVFGLTLMLVVDWRLLFVGVVVVVFALAYSGGKYPLAYNGLGDVCVLVFCGIVPVVFTYYIQAMAFTVDAFVCGAAVGFASINILVANNYRDYSSDKQANKRTTIVIFGKKFGEYFFLVNGFLAVAMCQYFWSRGLLYAAVLPLLYLILHIIVWSEMVKIGEGSGLIAILGKTARNTLIFSVLLFVGFLLDSL